jgi:hypothetical protein
MAGKKPQHEAETYSYAVVETALASVFGADPAIQRGAFRARLKHFQRLGLPGIESGKGTRIAYSADVARQWLVGLLMAEIGVDPILIVGIVKSRWDYLTPWLRRATEPGAAENPVFLGLRPRLMSGAWAGGKADPKTMEWISAFRRLTKNPNTGKWEETISPALDREGWYCVRNLTEALTKLQAGLQDHAGPALPLEA